MSPFEPSRRGFLALTGVGAAAVFHGYSAAPVSAAPALPSDPFTLGVASGDPRPDGVVLWTRLAIDPMAADGAGAMPNRQFPVQWQVASDEHFRQVVARGTTHAIPELAHSVHVEVDTLRPGRDYWFRFRCGRHMSPSGHTRTTPGYNSMPTSLTFALASCQAWVGGPYAAYRDMLDHDIDLVMHTGDYTYERRGDETLADFRTNHARYKGSADLRAAHAKFPFVVTFDDHEIENNWAGNISQPDKEDSNEPQRFMQLRSNAFQAYYEHLPLRRPQRPHGSQIQLFRRLDYGRLARFHVLDTRQYRSDQLTEDFPGGPQDPRVMDRDRTFMGDRQEKWLFDGLRWSPATWNVIAQQTMLAQYDYDVTDVLSVNHDQWDGYVYSRNRLMDEIAETRPNNPVVVTGDWHSSFVHDVHQDFSRPDSPVLATEFVGTSISSGCGWAKAIKAGLPANPHTKYINPDKRGYVLNTLTRTEWRADFRVVDAADAPGDTGRTDASFVVRSGKPGAVRV